MRMTQLDLGPQAEVVKRVVAGVRDDQLDAPTPSDFPVAGLLDHLVGLTLAFRMAAEKTPVPGPPSVAAENLAPDWRTRIPAQLDDLVAAWRRPQAWEGTAEAGGVTMPAHVTAAVALDEGLVHGWDLAVATGQEDDADPVAGGVGPASPQQTPAGPPQRGLFGPPVPVPDAAPPLHRLLGLTGRDPAWRPPG